MLRRRTRKGAVGSNPTLSARSMSTNSKGDLGQVKVMADLVASGYEVFTPLSGHSAVDLIAADSQMRLKRIQIKYRSAKNDRVELSFSTVVNRKVIPINMDLIDCWAVYVPEVEKIYYIKKSDVDCGKQSFTFRTVEPTSHIATSAVCGDEFLSPSRLWA